MTNLRPDWQVDDILQDPTLYRRLNEAEVVVDMQVKEVPDQYGAESC